MRTKTMKKKSALALALLTGLLTSSIAPAFADFPVSVDRVRWKKSFLSWKDHGEYPEWKNEGIWTEYRKNTFVAKHWQPSKSNTRTMVLLIAGQQGFSGSSGGSNCLTGQPPGWDDSWGSGDQSKTRYINSQSLAGKLANSGYLNSSNTFMAMVFNANFNWENTKSAKEKAEEAFADWFLKHGNSYNVDKIVLLGSSRGGALSVRLAQNILKRSEWRNVPIKIGLLDAVANVEQDELKTSGQPACTNPLNSKYYSRKADLSSFFSGLPKPTIRHVATGAPVVLGAVHSFCATENSWYDHSWANYEHKEIGRCVANEGDAYNQAMVSAGVDKLYQWVITQL